MERWWHSTAGERVSSGCRAGSGSATPTRRGRPASRCSTTSSTCCTWPATTCAGYRCSAARSCCGTRCASVTPCGSPRTARAPARRCSVPPARTATRASSPNARRRRTPVVGRRTGSSSSASGTRSSSSAAGPSRRAAAPGSVRCCSATTTAASSSTRARSAPGSATRCCGHWVRSSPAAKWTVRRSSATRCASETCIGYARSWSHRSGSPSGPATACCATRASMGCARTSPRGMSSAKLGDRSVGRRRDVVRVVVVEAQFHAFLLRAVRQVVVVEPRRHLSVLVPIFGCLFGHREHVGKVGSVRILGHPLRIPGPPGAHTRPTGRRAYPARRLFLLRRPTAARRTVTRHEGRGSDHTMKAITWQGKRDVRYVDVPDPKIEEGTDAVIKVTSTNICGSDLHLYEVLGAFMDAGDVLGHEAMGIVEEVGSAVTAIKPSDRVVIPSQMSCGDCFTCNDGLYSQCETTQVREYGSGAALFGYSKLYGQVAGGQAEYLRVPQAQFTHVRVPDGPPDERYVYLSDVLPTAWQAVEYAGIPAGGTVVVLGLGPIGDMACRVAQHMGVGRVIAVDLVPERLERARQRGVEVVDLTAVDNLGDAIRDMTGGRGPDSVVDAVGMEAHGSPVAKLAQQVTG